MTDNKEEINSQELRIPSDFLDIAEQAAEVPRYEDPRYPPGMIVDNLKDHLLRLDVFADSLGLDPETLVKVKRTIWVHDIPEITLGDQPATLKAERLVQTHDELTVARQVLQEEDLVLYNNYELSSAFLKGTETEWDETGLIVKILDSVEGNLFFHQHIHKWVTSGHIEMPPDTTLEFTFIQKNKYMLRIESIEDETLKELLKSILNSETESIKLLWENNPSQTPEVIKKYL